MAVQGNIILLEADGDLAIQGIPENILQFFRNALQSDAELVSLQSISNHGLYFVEKIKPNADNKELERIRKAGASITKVCNTQKCNAVVIHNQTKNEAVSVALAEGIFLANYQFQKYIGNAKPNTLEHVEIIGPGAEAFETTRIISEAVCIARDLVNEPVNFLNATELANAFTKLGETAGFKVEVLHEAQIETQKMGGLLAVNRGSQEPPTFSIMEYKPANAKNSSPIILVGKGVVFDTGGLSLKPTPNSMDYMKCDMAGGAVVGAVLWAVAKLNLPLHVVGLVPATDNRPGENAVCPGDIITTYKGTTVEVLNTDAEGRLILCDALAFAQKYNPMLVLDFATLTGAAARAIGPYGCAVMGNASEAVKKSLATAGEKVYERLVEFPLWDEYTEEMKGDISDLKNLGKADAGAQTAGAFLQHFTNYPWLHIDIAGTAFAHAPEGYKTKGGTGFGVRMMLEFLRNFNA